jgi:hypothetical protein
VKTSVSNKKIPASGVPWRINLELDLEKKEKKEKEKEKD